MTEFLNVTNNFDGVNTLSGMLGAANANTGGYTYIGLLVMMQIIILIAMLGFGFETAILASAFIALIAGLFFTYLGLISFSWLMFFVAQIIVMIIYITWQKKT